MHTFNHKIGVKEHHQYKTLTQQQHKCAHREFANKYFCVQEQVLSSIIYLYIQQKVLSSIIYSYVYTRARIIKYILICTRASVIGLGHFQKFGLECWSITSAKRCRSTNVQIYTYTASTIAAKVDFAWKIPQSNTSRLLLQCRGIIRGECAN